MTSPAGASSTSRLFYVTDRTTGTCFLAETGANVTVIPPSPAEKRNPASMILQAVNKSAIPTFGEKSMTLDIGHCRSYQWTIIADLPLPILGADFLAHFGFKVDVRNLLLIDTTTGLSLCGIQSNTPSPCPVFHFPASTPYTGLLRKFSDISRPCYNSSVIKHSVSHHIRTTGPPVFCRPRRLASHHLQIAKSEFDHMLQLGIIWASDSSWSSPLHIVPKPTPGDWRPCGVPKPTPGIHNTIADKLSRKFIDNVEWSLDTTIFKHLCNFSGTPDIDLFASRLNNKLPKYFSWRPDPFCTGVNAFSQSWDCKYGYAFPPFNQISKVLHKLNSHKSCSVLLIFPYWPSQPWFPIIP